MAHFARIKNNNVVDVVVISNDDIKDQKGNESEEIGVGFCKSIWGNEFEYKQTSYNGSIRKNYAAPGYTFDSTRNAFIPPKPNEDCILNEETCNWECTS